MSEIYKGTPSTAKAYAGVDAYYDFNNKTFHAVLNARVNAEVVKGSGQCVIHFDPEDWWIYIGHPDEDKRVQLDLAGLFNINAYFVIGTNIPGIPDPPSEIGDILGGDYSMKDDLSLIKGSGFGFGARMGIPTKDYKFLIFYANVGATAGFDMNLKNYGTDSKCKGSSEPVGINGWYAMGQVYGFIKAAIGVEVDLFAVSGRFDIMDLAVAAILQGKLPNPTWIKGACGGRYRILGGLVSGNCKFEFEMGSKCELVTGSPLAGIKVISDLSPAPNATDIDVFNAPQATFNLAIDKEFEMVDGNEINHVYRVKLASFKLLEGTNEILGTLEWNPQKDVIAFNSRDVLPSKKTIKISVKVLFEEKINGNWSTVYVKGVPAEEVKEQQFESGLAPDYIPHNNISYSYPLLDQFNFYPKESSQGYIQLVKGQPYLFELTSDWKQVGRYTASTGVKEFAFNYNKESLRVSYTQPSGMSNESIYTYQLVNVPAKANDAVDKNVTAKLETKKDGENETSIQTKDVEGTLSLLQEKSIFDAYFRTSKYNTFSDKINALTLPFGWSNPIYTGIVELGANYMGNELFEHYEIIGGGNLTSPLLDFEATKDNVWFNNYIGPLIYNNYPNLGLTTSRNPTPFLIPPVKAMYIRQFEKPILSEEFRLAPTINSYGERGGFIYNLCFYAAQDYLEIRNKAANYILSNTSTWASTLATSIFPAPPKGDYKFKIRYSLPGLNSITSEKVLTIINP